MFGNGTDAVPIPKFIYALRVWEGNKYLDFKEFVGGAEQTAEINSGWYLPDDAASELASAINIASSGASGASGDYDVSYDRATDKFTIQRTASGTTTDTVIEDCSVADWTKSADAITEVVQASAYTEGGSALDLGKSGTASNVASYEKSITAASGQAGVYGDIYITDLSEIRSTAGLTIRFGQDSSNHFVRDYNTAALATGWNTVGGASSDFSAAGSPDWNAIDFIWISFYTQNASGTIAIGNIKMDNFRVRPAVDFKILFNTGTNAASGAGTGYGYDVAADATGASSYLADNQLPNRIVSSQPIRRPRPRFVGMNREAVSESGIQTTRHMRTDILFDFTMNYIPENEFKDDWAPFMGKVDEVEGAWVRKLDFEFYPKAVSGSSGDYLVLHPLEEDWEPEEILNEDLPAFYRWTMRCREVIPKAGSLSLVDIYTRTPG
jgi:hypothetical protein